jgi:hypothetical protein
MVCGQRFLRMRSGVALFERFYQLRSKIRRPVCDRSEHFIYKLAQYVLSQKSDDSEAVVVFLL